MLTLPPAARSSLLHISSDALKWRVCHELLLERSSNFRPISTLQIVSHSISNFANIIQTSQILARILKIADEIAKSAVKKCYCRQIQVLIRNLNLDRRMAPSLQRQESRCSKMKISQHCTYFWGNDIQNVRHSWCHNLLLVGLGPCVELTKYWCTQWSDWTGTPQSKVSRKSSQVPPPFKSNFSHAHVELGLQKWIPTPGINGVTRFVVFLHIPTYLPLFWVACTDASDIGSWVQIHFEPLFCVVR